MRFVNSLTVHHCPRSYRIADDGLCRSVEAHRIRKHAQNAPKHTSSIPCIPSCIKRTSKGNAMLPGNWKNSSKSSCITLGDFHCFLFVKIEFENAQSNFSLLHVTKNLLNIIEVCPVKQVPHENAPRFLIFIEIVSIRNLYLPFSHFKI